MIRRFHGNKGVCSTSCCSSTDGDELGRQKSLLKYRDIYDSLLQVYSDGEGTVSASKFVNVMMNLNAYVVGGVHVFIYFFFPG